jgi:formamidopyrimidine-DNA glycosylase
LALLNIKLSQLGPDFLNNDDFDLDLFTKILKKRKKSNISTILMNQKIISGIGNYLKSEILYAARINPHRSVASLNEEDIDKLFKEGKRIIKASYRMGGTSKKDYVHVDGSKGTFQDFLKVYGKKEDEFGNKIVAEKTKDGRTTYWVPVLQK